MKCAFVLPLVATADVPLTMEWEDYKNYFSVWVNGEEEEASRRAVFEANMATIEAENAKGNTFTLGVNRFAHFSNEEFRAQFTGAKGGSVLGPDDAHLGTLEIGERASSLDWTAQGGVVNPVKDQGMCGSCWAFSAVGTIESAYAVAAGSLGSYAEQQLVDCDTTSDGCSGGYNQYGISYIGQTGACSETGYPYRAIAGSCQASSCSKDLAAGTVTGYHSCTGSNAGLESCLNTAPVSVTVAADSSWQLYRSGVLSKECDGNIDHAVIAVGYDADTFKIRNSWGSSWGEAGYVRVSKSTSNPYCLWNTSPFTAGISADVTV